MIVMGGMIVSRLLGYVRYKTIFYYFGRGPETDAFLGAFAVPDLLYILASGGAMTAAFIPIYSELIEKDKKEKAWRLAGSVVNISFIVIVPLIILGIIFAPQLTRVIVPGFNNHPETFNLCVEIMRIIFPMVILTSLSALCNGILQSHNHFTTPAVAWSLHNIGIISAAVLLHGILGIKGLGYGVLLGAFSMVAVQVPAIIKKGVRYRFTLGRGSPETKRVLKLFLPAMLGLSISQINLLIMPITFGSYMGEGAVTALQGGIRLLLLPLGIFGNAISMAIFPTLSRQAGSGRMDEFKGTLAKGISATFAFSLPSMVVFLLLGLPIVRFLFGGGQFSVADCEATSYALLFYAIGLPAHTAIQVISRGYYSMKDTRTPLFIGLFSLLVITIPFCIGLLGINTFSVNVLGNAVSLGPLMWFFRISPFYYLGGLLQNLTYGGVALSVSLATLFNFIALLIILIWRVPGIRMGEILVSFMRVGIAACVSGAGCYGAVRLTEGQDPFIQMIAGMTTICILYIGIGRFMKVGEINEMIQMFAGRLRRR